MLPIFFFKFLIPCPLVCKPLRKHALPDQTRAGFLFNLIRNPRGYQYIGTSPFPDSFHFAKSHTNPKHHRDWKTQIASTKFWSRPRLFSFIPSSELQTKKKLEASIGLCNFMGRRILRYNYFLCRLPYNNMHLLDECLSYSRVSHRFLKTEPPPKKIFPIPRKPQILKQKF